MNLREPTPVKLNPKLENMRVRHAQYLTSLMFSRAQKYNNMPAKKKKEVIKEMKDDLIEFDTYYLFGKYVMDTSTELYDDESDFAYVCLDTGVGYSCIHDALPVTGGG